MIRVEKLSKKIKNNNILDDISFILKSGDVLGVVGPNGTGKSTLITLLSTITKPTDGSVTFYENGVEIKNNIKSKIGYIPQQISLYEELSVKDNLLLFGSSKQTKKSVLCQAKEIAGVLNLLNNFNTKVSKLSGGNKRRVNIGIALMNNPRFIFMDEPVVGVDYTVKREIEQFINELKNRGKIIIIASHLIEFLKHTSNKLLILENGKQQYFGDFKNEI